MATLLKTPSAAEAARAELEVYLEATSRKSLLRFITCGSVDDGKSTLIGRLLYDSKLLFEDQLAALDADSKRSGTQGDALDLALLVDGLAAEREQGITIDVAYRFFATDERKFIVADTPGHEQYTRNMVTGASTADLAVILIDARKGVLPQTRRHSFLVRLLGIRNVVLAVNKMDLVGCDQAVFERIVADYRAFAERAGIDNFTAIPLSGLTGDNVIGRSLVMPWYRGRALLEHLDSVPIAARSAADEPFRMAVQWVNRPHQNFRGYAGTIASGRVRPGDEVLVLPAGRRTSVARIVSFDGDLSEAVVGQSVTITLADDVDCSRGDVITVADAPVQSASRIDATLVWMAAEPMVPHRAYWLKVGAATVSVQVSAPGAVTDVNNMEELPAATLGLNDIGRVEIELASALPLLPYAESRQLGGFILIDKASHATVAAGLVEMIDEPARHRSGGAPGEILWIGGEGRGAAGVRRQTRLKALGRAVVVLSEETMQGLAADQRAETLRRARETARLVSNAGIDVLVTLDAAPDEAYPGRCVDATETDDNVEDAWVI